MCALAGTQRRDRLRSNTALGPSGALSMLPVRMKCIVYAAVLAALLASCEEKPQEVGKREIMREEVTDVESWSTKVVQRLHGPPNSDAILVDVTLVDRAGNSRSLVKNIVGPLVFFEEERKIVSCESEGSMVGWGPIIFDLSGHRTNGPEHPGYLRQCDRIEDSSLLLLHYNLMKDGKPYNFARILSTQGKVVLEKELYTAGEFEVSLGEKKYRVRVPEPELPG